MKGVLGIVVALMVSLPLAAAAQEAPSQPVTGALHLAGKSIPLPAGAWRLVAQTRGAAGAGALPAAMVRSAVLMRVENSVVTGMLSASANEDWSDSGWGTTSDCTRDDTYVSLIHYSSATEISCRFANHVLSAADATAPGLRRDAAAAIAKARWTVPQTWLMAGFRIANRHDFIDVRYHFNPDGLADSALQLVWGQGPWTKESVQGDRRRRALVDALLGWSATALPAVEQGLYRVDAATDLGWPWGAAVAPAKSPAVIGGAISAIAQDDTGAGRADWRTSAAKTITWRVLGSIADLAVAYGFTGSALLSGGIAITGAAVNSALYFAHEIAWQAYLPGGERLPVLEVPSIGTAS